MLAFEKYHFWPLGKNKIEISASIDFGAESHVLWVLINTLVAHFSWTSWQDSPGFQVILGRYRAAGFSFYVLLLSIHTKEKVILSPKDLAINMEYWRRQKVRMREEWLLLPMDDMLSRWDLICILEFQSLGKTLSGLNYCFSDFTCHCDTILSWSTQRMNYLLFLSHFILHSGSKGDQGVGSVVVDILPIPTDQKARKSYSTKTWLVCLWAHPWWPMPTSSVPCTKPSKIVPSAGEKSSKWRSPWSKFHSSNQCISIALRPHPHINIFSILSEHYIIIVV